MPKPSQFVLFLEGSYPKSHLDFYRKLCRGRYKVAVDGGYRFFRAVSIAPDLLIGDFDSLKRKPKELSPKTEVISYPKDKDQTDAHLALIHALDHGARSVDIVQPSIGELDHFTANLMLLTLSYKKQPIPARREIRIVNHQGEIFLLRDSSRTIEGKAGEMVSVLPLSRSIVLACQGTEYKARQLDIKRGETAGCRNRMTGSKAVFRVKGEAFLFHSFDR